MKNKVYKMNMEELIGKSIKDWQILEIVPFRGTNGQLMFTQCFRVNNGYEDALLKIFDLVSCTTAAYMQDPNDAMEFVRKEVNIFEYEQKLATYCNKTRVTNLVRCLDSGHVSIEGKHYHYIIYEQPDSSIEALLDFSTKLDCVASFTTLSEKLKSLHDIANALHQLHSKRVAYQNVLPKAITVFHDKHSSFETKLSASGVARYIPLPHDESGLIYPHTIEVREDLLDLSFAAPESVYPKPDSMSMEEWEFKQDNYMLGGLIVYYMTGLCFNALISQKIGGDLSMFLAVRSTYEEAIPDLLCAYERALDDFEAAIHLDSIKKELRYIVSYLCHPEIKKRKNPIISNQSKEFSYNIDRTRERLDLLRRKVEIELVTIQK